jgi:DNA mismatch endonuclease (patch repair protein)
MADVFSKRKRSEVMSRIRSRGNRDTELALAKLLRRHGIKGWRRHVEIRGRAVLPRGPKNQAAQQRRPTNNQRTARPFVAKAMQGRRSVPTFRVKPDFVFLKSRTAIFVDGCFWHGCPKHATKPANNRAFWQRKLAGNKKRDRVVNHALRRAGWRVFRVWEHELAKKNEARLVRRVRRQIRQRCAAPRQYNLRSWFILSR